jgi:hypothetical protein
MVALEVFPMPASVEVTWTLLFFTPTEMAVTFTETVQEVCCAKDALDKLTEEVGVEGIEVDTSGAATETKITLDFSPPGAGLTTATGPRPAAATNASGTEPVSSVELTNVVLRDVPFQTIVEAGTNPVPLTMSVTPVDPGFMLTDETISIKGTGLLAART